MVPSVLSKPIPQPKGKTRRQIRGRRQRVARVVVKSVRAQCVERDGYCRIGKDNRLEESRCDGPSQWCHYGPFKRARTRGQAPEARHTTSGSFMGCERHHADYDAGRLKIRALTRRLCDGPLSYRRAA